LDFKNGSLKIIDSHTRTLETLQKRFKEL